MKLESPCKPGWIENEWDVPPYTACWWC